MSLNNVKNGCYGLLLKLKDKMKLPNFLFYFFISSYTILITMEEPKETQRPQRASNPTPIKSIENKHTENQNSRYLLPVANTWNGDKSYEEWLHFLNKEKGSNNDST